MRITDANQHFSGPEPKFNNNILSKMDMIVSLNWYAANKSNLDSIIYAEKYFKAVLKTELDSKSVIPTFGFLCRMITNGAILSEKDLTWFNNQITELQKSTIKITPPPDQKQKNVQEKIKDKSDTCIAELEGIFDDFVTSKFNTSNIIPYNIMKSFDIKVAKDIIIHFKNKRVEFQQILTTNDPQLIEGYNNFTKIQIRKIINFIDLILSDASRIGTEVITNRKPRTKKVTPVDQLLSKVQYCTEYPELNIKSIEPKSIIGSNQVWLYNTKYRKLILLNAQDGTGFSIKGTTIYNIDEQTSIQKIAKPEVVLGVLKATKVGLRNIMTNIRTTASLVTGRLNTDTIILKAIK